MTSPGTERTDGVEIVVTGPPDGTLTRIIRALVDERLVACGQITPQVQSVYRWEGAVEEETEARAHLHTVASLVPAVTARVRELHPYDVPCVIALPLVGGDPEYLDWLHTETEGPR